jgi:phosphoserine phosphatase
MTSTPVTTSAAADTDDNGISGEEMLEAFHNSHHHHGGQRRSSVVQGQNVAAAMRALAMADCVCFDVDSTVVDEEGIDVLAAHLGKGDEVAALTLQAMEGGLPFQDALQLRLDLLQPSRAAIQACLRDHPLKLSPGAGDFIAKLHAAKKHVHLVSGGFRIMIEPVAQLVHVPMTNIVANTILFDADGNYAGFDANEPTSRDMGKPAALRAIQEQRAYKCMVMIGDGATDAQAKPPASAFIGYGGIAVREKVQKVADWFVTDFDDLSYIVDQYCNSPK